MAAETPKKLPLALPEIGEEEIAEVIACLRSGWITSGPRVKRFEADFAAKVGASRALAFSSCTAALHVAFRVLGVKEGVDVVLPPFTWASTANMVVACGGRPVFADIDPVTWNLSPQAVAEALTPATKLVVPVHYAGLPADLDGIARVLREKGREDVKILEDAAHAAGASYKGRPIGSDGNPSVAACFSFHPIKNMTTGEGGMLVTGGGEIAREAGLWRFHGVARDAYTAYSGKAPPPGGYDIVLPGFKYNMTDIQAALGIHQLKKLDRMNAKRADLVRAYREALADLEGLELPGRAPYEHVHSHHLFPLLAPAGDGSLEGGAAERVRIVRALAERGIGTGRHFEAIHLARFYRERFGTGPGLCPVAEKVASRVLSLPLYPGMEIEDVERVAQALKEVWRP